MAEATDTPGGDLAPAAIARRLATRWLGRRYEFHAACPSTNDEAARRAGQEAPAGLVVVADAQSAGRGRLGRSWQSRPGENLTFSFLLRPDCLATALPPLTLVVGAAVADTLAGRGLSPRLKWPNDVLIDGPQGPRKLVGVLTEMSTQRDRVRQVVVGVGINVNQTDFPADLIATATSLKLITGAHADRGHLLCALLERLEPALEEALADGVEPSLARWRHFAALPRPCRVAREGSVIEGTALDIDAQGALLVRDAQGQVQRVLAGELLPA